MSFQLFRVYSFFSLLQHIVNLYRIVLERMNLMQYHKMFKWRNSTLIHISSFICFVSVPAGGKPNYLDFVARKSLAQEPLTPTGYTQPPTPDFPPPSPATAMQGIEMKIQEMVSLVHYVIYI